MTRILLSLTALPALVLMTGCTAASRVVPH